MVFYVEHYIVHIFMETSEEGTPLFKGQNARSRGCPLLGGTTVIGSRFYCGFFFVCVDHLYLHGCARRNLWWLTLPSVNKIKTHTRYLADENGNMYSRWPQIRTPRDQRLFGFQDFADFRDKRRSKKNLNFFMKSIYMTILI